MNENQVLDPRLNLLKIVGTAFLTLSLRDFFFEFPTVQRYRCHFFGWMLTFFARSCKLKVITRVSNGLRYLLGLSVTRREQEGYHFPFGRFEEIFRQFFCHIKGSLRWSKSWVKSQLKKSLLIPPVFFALKSSNS